MKLLLSLALTASVVKGFLPIHGSVKIRTFGAHKQETTALFSAVPKWGQTKAKSTQLEKPTKSTSPVVPAFVNGIALGGVAFAAALCCLFFHIDPIMLLGGGALMAVAAAVAGASDKQAVSTRDTTAPIEAEPEVESMFMGYESMQAEEEPLISEFDASEPFVGEFEELEAAEADFIQTLGESYSQQPDEGPTTSDPVFPTSNTFSLSSSEAYVPTTSIDPPIGSPLEVIDPNNVSDEPMTGISCSEIVSNLPLVPATALYSSASTQLDADEVPLRTKIDRLKRELDLAQEFFDENL